MKVNGKGQETKTYRSVPNRVRRSRRGHAAQGGSAGEAQKCRRTRRTPRRGRSRLPMVRILRERCRHFYVSDPRGERVPCGEEVRGGVRMSEVFHREGLQREGGHEPQFQRVACHGVTPVVCAAKSKPPRAQEKDGNEGKAAATYMMQISMSL